MKHSPPGCHGACPAQGPCSRSSLQQLPPQIPVVPKLCLRSLRPSAKRRPTEPPCRDRLANPMALPRAAQVPLNAQPRWASGSQKPKLGGLPGALAPSQLNRRAGPNHDDNKSRCGVPTQPYFARAATKVTFEKTLAKRLVWSRVLKIVPQACSDGSPV